MDKILDKLASVIAAAAELNYATVPGGEARQLYLYHLPATDADATAAAVLKPTGGPSPVSHSPVEELTCQVFITGKTQKDALDLGWTIHRACKDDDNLPLRNVSVDGWLGRFLRIDPVQPPMPIGADDDGRTIVTMNIAYAVALAKS